MVKQAQTLNLRRWSSRTQLRVGLPLVIAVLFSIAMVQLWTGNTTDLAVTTGEKRGVEYLKPLSELMDRMVVAQSAAVRSVSVDATGLRGVLVNVDKADKLNGSFLGTTSRWMDVRTRIDGLLSTRPTGETAYRSYSDVVQLINDLIRKIGDSSQLMLDPTLDSYYLMDAAVLRLPTVLMFAGRAADLSLITSKIALTDEEARRQAEIRIAVARYQVALQSDEVAGGVRKALDITRSTSLGPGITNQLDAFRASVDAFVPPINLIQNFDKVDSAMMTANADRVREASRKLINVVLSELDKLLTVRETSQSIRRSQGLGLGLLCVILTGLLVWLQAITRPEATQTSGSDEAAASTKVRRATRKPAVEEDYDAAEDRVSEELVHVGRGIRARRRERADNAR